MREVILNNRGFTFVESIICFAIVGIFLALTWASINFFLMKSNDQTQYAQAHFLAVEAIEQVKQIRQTSVNRHHRDGFFEVIGSKTGNYILHKKGDEYELVEGRHQIIEMEEGTYTAFCRTLTFEGLEENIKQVTAQVRFGDASDCSLGDKVVSYSAQLYSVL